MNSYAWLICARRASAWTLSPLWASVANRARSHSESLSWYARSMSAALAFGGTCRIACQRSASSATESDGAPAGGALTSSMGTGGAFCWRMRVKPPHTIANPTRPHTPRMSQSPGFIVGSLQQLQGLTDQPILHTVLLVPRASRLEHAAQVAHGGRITLASQFASCRACRCNRIPA